MSTYLNLEELVTERDDLNQQAADHLDGNGDPLTEDEEMRLFDLNEVIDELDLDGSAYNSMETAIPDADFEEYAEQLADDCGLVDRDSSMRFYIDWASFANDLKMDYTPFTFDGVDYWVRLG